MARVVEGCQATGTWARPATPQMEKVGEEWVSKGWNELEHQGWIFKAFSRPPVKGDDQACAALRNDLSLGPIPLPEMVFVQNLLECRHPNSGVTLFFTARDVLAGWHAQQQKQLGSRLSHQQYDFTFSSPYSGGIDKDREILREKLRLARRIEAPDFATPVKCKARIPMDVLQGRGHIHFYDALELIADDLGGRGSCQVSVKIRVMDDFFLILLRTYILLNDDRVCLRDVRYFHRFGDLVILRDEEVREATYAQLQSAVARLRPVSASVEDRAMHDPRFYTNPEQVWEALAPSKAETECIALEV